MKKNLLPGLACFGMFIFATISVVCASGHEDELQNAFNQIIIQNNKFATCPSGYNYNDARKILGVSNGKCHFYNAFFEVDDKKVPISECFVPMNVLKQEVQKQNEMLAKGILSFNSANDPFIPYCKKLHGTIKTNHGSVSY